MAKSKFQNHYTSLQMKIIKDLSQMEMEDENRCANCGGEDCICCEYYHDRQKWVEPDELFESEMYNSQFDDDYYRDDYEEE